MIRAALSRTVTVLQNIMWCFHEPAAARWCLNAVALSLTREGGDTFTQTDLDRRKQKMSRLNLLSLIKSQIITSNRIIRHLRQFFQTKITSDFCENTYSLEFTSSCLITFQNRFLKSNKLSAHIFICPFFCFGFIFYKGFTFLPCTFACFLNMSHFIH